MDLNAGRFLGNGCCGYVLKPPFLRSPHVEGPRCLVLHIRVSVPPSCQRGCHLQPCWVTPTPCPARCHLGTLVLSLHLSENHPHPCPCVALPPSQCPPRCCPSPGGHQPCPHSQPHATLVPSPEATVPAVPPAPCTLWPAGHHGPAAAQAEPGEAQLHRGPLRAGGDPRSAGRLQQAANRLQEQQR